MSIYNKIIDLQKLNQAWDKVKKNKPAAGVDNITYEQYEETRKEEIRKLQEELREHSYDVLPVRLVNLYKGEKVRTIALYSMRDKVVQQSLAVELGRIFDKEFTDRTYAYRSNKSALNAIGEIESAIGSGKYAGFLKVDISHYFDTIRWKRLETDIRKYIGEEDVIELIRKNSCSVSLDETTGELVEKREGIYQGSGIAPILSNIYLMEFDRYFSAIADVFFIRYSDDMILLGKDREAMVDLLMEIKAKLEERGLCINESKSVVGEIEKGFDFLGYHFDSSGKSIPSKAEDNLNDRLETMWLTSGNVDIVDKLKKVLEIVGGWEQYFRGERNIGSIFEYSALVYTNGNRQDDNDWLVSERKNQENIYRDIAGYLAGFWREKGNCKMELFEYEQFYEVCKEYRINAEYDDSPYLAELLTAYRRFYVIEDEDQATELMQSYADLKYYDAAEHWQAWINERRRKQENNYSVMLQVNGKRDIVLSKSSAAKVYAAFVGREDVFAKEGLDERRGRRVDTELRPITEQIIREHLAGRMTVDSFIQRPNSTVKYMVIDVDLSKKIVLQFQRESDEYQRYMQKALDYTVDIKRILSRLGMTGYIEYSGSRGYHLWLFFNEWIPTRYANMLSDIVDKERTKDEDITIEYFPNKTRLKEGRYGQTIKIPYGIHVKTGERTYFFNEEGQPVMESDVFVDGIAKASLTDIKRIIAVNMKADDETGSEKSVDTDISALGNVGDNIKSVLMGCSLLRYLCLKSVKTGYLTHFERLTILYVFGHMGDDGKEFVHTVMKFTLNYKHDVTEHFIRRRPDKPVSCIKLRDQYKQLTAEFGCSCSFKRSQNCYPSPVLHAISSSTEASEQVTLPLSRTLTKEKEAKVKNEMNVYNKTQDIAVRLQDFKKQIRGLNKAVSKLERELGEIYDERDIDELEIEMGVLRRRRSEKGVEWFIEI